MVALATLTPVTDVRSESEPPSEVPTTPLGLQVTTEQGSLSVGLDWDDVEGASGYRVRWRLAGPGHTLNEGLEVQESEATITVDGFGEWLVRVDVCDATDCRLGIDKRIMLNPASDGEISVGVDWDDVEGASGYRVRWRLAGLGHTLNEGLEVEESEATITVDDFGEWVVRVDACDATDCRLVVNKRVWVNPAPEAATEPDIEEEEEAEAEPTPEPTPEPEPEQAPGRPTGLLVRPGSGPLEVSADWDDVDGAATYLVRWRLPGEDTPLSDGVETSVSEATVTVEAAGIWVVRVEACNTAGCGFGTSKRVRVPEPQPVSDPEDRSADAGGPDQETPADALTVTVVATPTDPTPGQPVNMTAEVANAPAGLVPTFRWEMNVSGWFTVRTAPNFSYAGNRDETWDYRVIATYPDGQTAVSDPITISWLTQTARNALADNNEITTQSENEGVQGNQGTDTTLISNTGQTQSQSIGIFAAQSFTAGSNATLTEVRLPLSASGTSTKVVIRESNASNLPGDEVATLTNPTDLTVGGTLTFTAPANTTLTSGTTYWVSVNDGLGSLGGTKNVSLTTGTGVTGESGWTRGNLAFRTAETSSWSTSSTDFLRFEVLGTVSGSGDPTVSFSSSTYTAAEGSTATVTVNLSAAISGGVTIPITHTAQGGATAQGETGADYSGVPANLAFSATETSKSFMVSAAQDTDNDDNESVGLGFGDLPSGVAAGTTNEATVWITDDDADDPALISNLSGTTTITPSGFMAQGFTTGAGGATVSAVKIRFSSSQNEVSVKIRKDTTTGCGGTLTSCPDFSANGLVATLTNPANVSSTGVLHFTAPGGASLDASTTYWVTIHEGVTVSPLKTIDLTTGDATSNAGWTMGDQLRRPAETSSWTLDAGSDKAKMEILGTASAGPSTKVTLSVSPTSIDEEDGAQSVAITATLDGQARSTATTVNLAFGDTGTAKIGSAKDYEVLPAGTGTNTITTGTITIAANQPSGSTSFRFRPVNDIIDEGTSETITITGTTTASGLTGGVDSVDLTLDDDDTVGTAIGLSFTTATTAEGASPITNQRIQARFSSGKARTVATTIALSYSTSTATLGTDYTVSSAWPTSITIPANQNSGQSSAVTFTPLDDNVFEGTDLVIAAGTLSGFTFDNASISITNEDDAPDQVVLSFTPVSEGAGATTSTVTATLANSDSSKPQDVVLTQDVTVTLALGTGGTATSGTDYTALQSPLPTVTISAGQLSGTASISITPTADTVDDDGETIPFTASATTSQSGVTLTGVGANMVITEDVALITNLPSTRTDIVPNKFVAQSFTTGSAPSTITEIKVKLAASGSATSLRIRKNSPQNQPDFNQVRGGLVATLDNPGTVSTGVNTFTPAAGETITLEPNTTYWVTVNEGISGSTAKTVNRNSSSDSVSSAASWTLGSRLSRSSESNSWSSSSAPIQFEVRGTVLVPVTLSIVDSAGNAVTSISEAVTTAKSIKIKATASEAVSANTEITLSVAGTASGGGTDYTATFPTTVTISSGNTSGETAVVRHRHGGRLRQREHRDHRRQRHSNRVHRQLGHRQPRRQRPAHDHAVGLGFRERRRVERERGQHGSEADQGEGDA